VKIGRVEDEELWAAIGEPSRRQLLDVLISLGEATPSAIALELPLTRQAVTKHLAVLDRVGLVDSQRVGREVRYTVRTDRLNEAALAMVRVATQWDKRLLDIKSAAEATHRKRSKKS